MRFSEKDPMSVALPDFSPRDRARPTIYIILTFVCTIAAVLGALHVSKGGEANTILSYTLFTILAVSCLISVYFRRKSDDLVLSTEFQNLIYSSAASLGSQFCIITKRDGVTVHASHGLSELFDGFPYPISQALEGFFIEGRIPKFDQDKIIDALLMNERKSVLLKISTSMGINDMVISIDPLPRPHGYYAIKGRYYQGTRKGGSAVLSDISIETMRRLLEESPVGHFICDDHGRFEYINPALARLIGKTPQTLLEERLHLNDVLKLTNGNPIARDYEFHDLKEEVLLIHSSGTPTRLHLNFSLIREAGRMTALVGTVAQE